MSEHTDREAILREIAKKNVVYKIPGMDMVSVRRDLTYRSRSGARLLLDVYCPSVSPSQHPPIVLLPMAYPDPTARVRSYGPLTSWARLMAASGMAAVVYGAEAPDEDVHAVLRQLRSDADALGLDIDKFGLFAASGNVTVALSALMRDRRVSCAALLYGCTMDMDGSTAVADMGRQAGFVNACAAKSSDDLPDGSRCSSYAQDATTSRASTSHSTRLLLAPLRGTCRCRSSTTRPGLMALISTKTQPSRAGSFSKCWRFYSFISAHALRSGSTTRLEELLRTQPK